MRKLVNIFDYMPFEEEDRLPFIVEGSSISADKGNLKEGQSVVMNGQRYTKLNGKMYEEVVVDGKVKLEEKEL